MRLTVESGKINLAVPTTDKGVKNYELSMENVFYWYPFNVNFYYRYSRSKQFIYLVKEEDYHGENVYNVDILKRSKRLENRNGVMIHPHVYKRNMYIMGRAKDLGLPTMREEYTIQDVEGGFSRLDVLIRTVKDSIENRLLDSGEEEKHLQSGSDEWDKEVYSIATEKELQVIQEFGEMYAMLTVMRKIAEGR